MQRRWPRRWRAMYRTPTRCAWRWSANAEERATSPAAGIAAVRTRAGEMTVRTHGLSRLRRAAPPESRPTDSAPAEGAADPLGEDEIHEHPLIAERGDRAGRSDPPAAACPGAAPVGPQGPLGGGACQPRALPGPRRCSTGRRPSAPSAACKDAWAPRASGASTPWPTSTGAGPPCATAPRCRN